MLRNLLPAALLVVVAEAAPRPHLPFSGFNSWSHNDLSELGTLQAKHLPMYRTDNPLPAGFPWGKKNPQTNYYTDYPYTGVTRYYDWTINKQSCAPDGVNTTCLLVNGKFPGPLIEANWGDTIEVKVTNCLSDEGAAIHWHGILQKGSQPSDGVPGVSHCPIAPGKTLTYTFNAELYGTSWWHGHYSSQYASGMMGPMVIYGPNTTTYDIDLGPIQMSDWYHTYYNDLLDALSVPDSQGPVYPQSDNILINGKNPYDCSKADGSDCSQAPLSTFNLTSGKTHRTRFINAGADATLKISLDDHQFEIIANDFVPVQSYFSDVITLGIGQHTDVIVHGKNTSYEHTSYVLWLRLAVVLSPLVGRV